MLAALDQFYLGRTVIYSQGDELILGKIIGRDDDFIEVKWEDFNWPVEYDNNDFLSLKVKLKYQKETVKISLP